MAVYTEVGRAELESFLSGYGLGNVRRFEGIAEGIENSNFYLETDAGRFILTLFEQRAKQADLPYFMQLMNWLAGRGFPCPLPQPDRDGRVLQSLRGKPAAIVSFLEGAAVRKPDRAHCREGGEGLGRLHRAGEVFPGYRANDLGHQAWAGLFEGRETDAEALRLGIADDILKDLETLAGAWPRDLPQGAIHADLFPDNVFFSGGLFSGAIDFYFACNDALAYDLAVTLNAWCFSAGGRLDPQRARALVEGYERARPLSPAEREGLPTLARGAAMRFFLTRLIDWTSTPKGALVTRKDPLEYAAKLDFYRACDGSLAALGLAA